MTDFEEIKKLGKEVIKISKQLPTKKEQEAFKAGAICAAELLGKWRINNEED